MTTPIFVGRGNGYEGDSCFDGFTILAAPLPGYSAAEREARIFRRPNGGTDYGAHVIALATPENRSTHEGGRALYLLVSHGGGREVLALPSFYDGGAYERALIALPERVQFAALYVLYRTAKEADTVARIETRAEWSQAFVDKRIKKSRPKQGRVSVTIEAKP